MELLAFRKDRTCLALVLALSLAATAGAQGQPTTNGTLWAPAVQGDCAPGEDCFRLRVRCTRDPNNEAVPLRFRTPSYADVVIRQSGVEPDANPLGGVVFFTGLYGNFFYSNGNAPDTSPASLLVTLVGEDYTTFEVKWLDADPSEIGTSVVIPDNPIGVVDQTANPGRGHVSGSEGYGAKVSTCGVREVLEWLSMHRTPSGDQKLCATGNSGGGAQIGYALAVYGAANYLKSAVLTASPPYARIFDACYARLYNNGLDYFGNPDGSTPSMTLGFSLTHPGRQLLEANLGWPAGACYPGHSFSTDVDKKLFAQKTSLMATSETGAELDPRDYAPQDAHGVLTNQFFVRGVLENSGAQIHSNAYLSKVATAGGLVPGAVNDVTALDGGTPPDYLQHEIQNTTAGAVRIRNFLTSNNNCKY